MKTHTIPSPKHRNDAREAAETVLRLWKVARRVVLREDPGNWSTEGVSGTARTLHNGERAAR